MIAIAAVVAVEPKGQEQTDPTNRKKLINLVPQHLPLKIKIKNLESEKWVHDLEVEVTNTSDKPIYFIEFFLVMPEIKSEAGHDTEFALKWP